MASDFRKVDPIMIDRYTRAGTRQASWATEFEGVRDYVRPNAPSINAQPGRGQQTTQHIFDSTAMWAHEQLASGLHSYLTDPGDRWFSLGLRGIPFEDMDHDQMAYLEQVTDRIFLELQNPTSRFMQSIKEVFLDVSSFGTAVLFQEWSAEHKIIQYRSYPLASCTFEESSSGLVDVVFRDMMMSVRQIKQDWPDAVLPDFLENSEMSVEVKVTHAVYPNSDYDSGPLKFLNKRYLSIYFIEESTVELSRGGYDVFPYQVPRWTTMAGEIYGRGPAITALPDIQLLNIMKKEVIMAAQLANRPPLVVDDDGFLLPIGYKPGSLIFKTPGTDAPEPLRSGGEFGITLELMNQQREQISKAFHVDWLLRERKKERQSVHEITDDRGEMLRQLSSVLGRLESELTSPAMKLTFHLLSKAGQLPEAPEGMQGQLEIIYTSSASKAQNGTKAQSILQYLTDVTPIAQVDPAIYDGIDMTALGQELAILRDVSRRVLRDPAEVQKIKQDRENAKKQEQASLQTQQMGDMAGALKDVASANESGLLLGG